MGDIEDAMIKPDDGYQVGVMGTKPVPRQSQSWVISDIERLLGEVIRSRVQIQGWNWRLRIIPCISGMAAARWAAVNDVPFELYLPWSTAELPVALEHTDPFVHDEDAGRILDDAQAVHTLSSSREFSTEAMVNCRRHLLADSQALIVTHDGRSGKAEALTLRARSRGLAIVLVDWRNKKTYVINEGALPHVEPEPF